MQNTGKYLMKVEAYDIKVLSEHLLKEDAGMLDQG